MAIVSEINPIAGGWMYHMLLIIRSVAALAAGICTAIVEVVNSVLLRRGEKTPASVATVCAAAADEVSMVEQLEVQGCCGREEKVDAVMYRFEPELRSRRINRNMVQGRFYAVRKGRIMGIYRSWEMCKA
ncbi:hypothetical protein M758_UG190000 [Ceratodon purpureus]|nr:hypothetical protein M758_UG190000 [Ceratodon purpureus]